MNAPAKKRLQCPVCKQQFPPEARGCPEHGATLINIDAIEGRIIAQRWELRKVVGKGGMGSVYDAVHTTTGKRVAVKLLAPHLSKDLKLVARFRREAMAASRLKHPNCVQVIDFGEDGEQGGTFYIVMEFIDGRGLAQELRRTGPLEVSRVATIAVQLLSALDAAHDAGILHRDLKPQNVMLTDLPGREDLVKVVDFGIAKFIENSKEDQVALTVPGTIFGTPEYMSPEQARGEVLDERSDIYSAATVLWQMLLGRSPFRGKTVRDTLANVFHKEPPKPSLERPLATIPESFENALLCAMSKDRDERFRSARAFLEAIRPYAPGADNFDRPAKLPESGTDSAGRQITTVTSMAAVAPGADATEIALPVVSVTEAAVPLNSAAPVSADEAVAAALATEAAQPRFVEQSTTAREPTIAEPHLAPANLSADELLAVSSGLSVRALVAILAVCALVGLGVLGFAGWWFLHSPEGDPVAPPPKLTIDRRAAAAAMGRAEHAMGERNYAAARVAFEEALEADPTDANAHFKYAMSALQNQDLDTAERHLELAAGLDPKVAPKAEAMRKLLQMKRGKKP